MKTLHLSVIVILSISLVIANHQAFGYENNVKILNIHTQPSTIKVDDKFTITATLVNNSTVPIVLDGGKCSIQDMQAQFFTIMFDNHTTIKSKNLTCAGVGWSQILNPGKKITETSPDSTLAYIATESGTANVTVTYSYDVTNQTDPTQPNIKQTISKSLLFTIYDKDTIVKSLKLGNHPVINKIQSPLKQLHSGVAANDVICRPDMQLLIQNQENFPICVKLNSVSNLLRQDWSYPSNCKYVRNPFTAGVEGIIIIEKNSSNPSTGKSYSPKNSTVVIGWNNTVSWENLDIVPSSVTSDWNLFDSGPILPENEWRHDFECAGNYGYHSEPHPWMKGWIRVLPPSR
ncbi:MAG: hypothetical protein KGH99_01005 [Thaumarchaeota archaeon]|nr:hypothetical protein [Candidatus Nitrosotalea sp.]MDE1872038.1 hypothetical protein [Nitrososphaerota archaeon]